MASRQGRHTRQKKPTTIRRQATVPGPQVLANVPEESAVTVLQRYRSVPSNLSPAAFRRLGSAYGNRAMVGLIRPTGSGVVIQRQIPTLKKWKKLSRIAFGKRSDQLKEIDAAVASWHTIKDDPDLDKRWLALFTIRLKIFNWMMIKLIQKGKVQSKRLKKVKALIKKIDHEDAKLTIIRRIKKRFGVTLVQSAGVQAVKTTYGKAPVKVRKGLRTRDWTIKELKDVEKALGHYEALLGANRTKKGLGAQPITTFSRLKRGIDVNTAKGRLDTTTAGETFRGSKNITMFDVGGKITDFAKKKNKPTKAELRQGFRGTIIHELSHGLVEQALSKVAGGKSVISQWVKEIKFWSGRYKSNYWRPAGKRYGQSGFSMSKTKKAAKAAGVELPITNYGFKNANEDLAETMMFYFEAPAKHKSSCPNRDSFVEKYIKPLLAKT
jgi:hypothetical protein